MIKESRLYFQFIDQNLWQFPCVKVKNRIDCTDCARVKMKIYDMIEATNMHTILPRPRGFLCKILKMHRIQYKTDNQAKV